MAEGFDRVAGFYDRMMRAVFGKSIVHAQTHFLPLIPPQAQKILIIGGGTGWIIQEVLKINPKAQIIFIEISPKMIQQAQKKISSEQVTQVNFIHGDENKIKDFAPYDIIISNFFLDLFFFENSKKITNRFYENLNPGGLLLYTDFYAENDPLRLRKLGINFMYWVAHRLCQLEARHYWNYEKCILDIPFSKKDEKFFYFNTIQSIVFCKN